MMIEDSRESCRLLGAIDLNATRCTEWNAEAGRSEKENGTVGNVSFPTVLECVSEVEEF